VNDEQAPPTESAGAGPDVEIEASANARKLRVLERPRVELSVMGGAHVRRDDDGQRENLPRRLEPGRTYRDVWVNRRLAGRLEDSAQDRLPG